eukprot:scaffold128587_cov69-Phaeocystis_antarctica.AAC.3
MARQDHLDCVLVRDRVLDHYTLGVSYEPLAALCAAQIEEAGAYPVVVVATPTSIGRDGQRCARADDRGQKRWVDDEHVDIRQHDVHARDKHQLHDAQLELEELEVATVDAGAPVLHRPGTPDVDRGQLHLRDARASHPELRGVRLFQRSGRRTREPVQIEQKQLRNAAGDEPLPEEHCPIKHPKPGIGLGRAARSFSGARTLSSLTTAAAEASELVPLTATSCPAPLRGPTRRTCAAPVGSSSSA